MSAERPTLLSTGVEPIDSALGGLEAGRAHVLYGDAETGKTAIAMRFLITGLRRSEPCALVVRYSARQAIDAISAFGYDCNDDVEAGRLLLFDYAPDIVDSLATVDDLQVILDEFNRVLGHAKPTRIVFDTADFVFSIRFGYGYPLQISAFTAALAGSGAACLLVVDERMADRVVQSFRANASTVMQTMTRRFDGRVEYHLSFEKAAVKAPSRRVGFSEGAFETLEIYDARARTLPLPGSPRRRQAGDRTGQLTIPEEASRIVAEAAGAASSPPPSPTGAPSSAPAAPARPSARSGRGRVLVIDEERVSCQLLGRALASECDIAIEADGIAGLARLTAFDPDLVIVESSLPLVDGFAVCRQIRESSTVPIVMITRTHSSPEDRIRSAEAGADLILVKPFSLRELSLRARQLIARFRGRPIPAGNTVGSSASDPLVTYDQFVEGLLLSGGGAARSLIGCRVESAEEIETGRVLDVVRAELGPEDALTYEREERQLVARVLSDVAEEIKGALAKKIRDVAGLDVRFWVAPIAKGAAVRVLAEQFERERRRLKSEGLEVRG